MAQVEDKNGRSPNIELNLVPIIDLMSVLITFLLITAVWTQVSMIQLGSSIYGRKTEQNQEIPPPPPQADIPLRVDVKENGFRVVIGSEKIMIAKKADGYDYPGLMERLKAIKEKYPDKTDGVITVDEVLAYENLITGMDTMIQSGFQTISVSTAESE
ncbi:MAG: biopolymer transporter ExbD [Proteobacteria bacterium]|nr:MAG: biopolymer transporter ExbD [Pseudomonadota bacterium]